MTPTSLLRIFGSVLGVAAVLFLAGCRKSATSYNQGNLPQPAQTVPDRTSPAQNTAAERAEAKRAVVDYVTALINRKYNTAYEMLSRDSKAEHSLSDFERRGKQGMPPLDLDSAKVSSDNGQTMVEVNFIEEPGSHGFYLVREDGAWKIVYRGGSPGAPYPGSSSGG